MPKKWHRWCLHRKGWIAVSCVLTAIGALAVSSSAVGATHKSPIKVFVYGDLTQPAPEAPLTFERNTPAATLKAIDALGGINGAHVEMTFCDSKSNPNTTLACAREAIAGHYAAVIDEGSSYGTGGADALLVKAKLPLFYAIPSDSTEINAPDAVCPTSTLTGTGLAISLMAKELHIKQLSLAYINIPSFAAVASSIEAGLKKSGLSYPASVPFPASTADFSSVFAQAMTGGAQGLYYANFGAALSPSIKQFLQAYPGKKLILQALEANTLQQVGSVSKGTIYYPLWSQPIASNVPGAKQYVAALKKYDPTASADIANDYMPQFLTVKLFAGIAGTIHGTVDAASMLAAIKHASNVSMGGLLPNYNGAERGKVGLGRCVYQAGIVPVDDVGETFKSVNGTNKFLDTVTGKLING